MKPNLLFMTVVFFLLIPSTIFSQINPNGGIVYVNQNIGSSGDGNSWGSAVQELADVLKAAESNSTIKEIWVAEGTYTPQYTVGNSPTERDKTFLLPGGVSIYGGFAGTESDINDRTGAHETILSGVIGASENDDDSVYHVVLVAGASQPILLDGVTVTGGCANYRNNYYVGSTLTYRARGSGIYIVASADVTLSNITVKGNGTLDTSSGNEGGGICIWTGSKVMMDNIRVEDNYAYSGGGIYNYGAEMTIKNSIIANNTTSYSSTGINNATNAKAIIYNTFITDNTCLGTTYLSRGGGVSNSNSNMEMYNVQISGNKAYSGAGIFVFGTNSKITITNATITANNSTIGYGGVYITEASSGSEIRNSIIWNNTNSISHRDIYATQQQITYSYSLVGFVSGNNLDGGNNASTDPMFADEASGDYTLTSVSPAVNGGNNSFITGFDIDLAGGTRIYNGTVDMGAYEFHAAKVGPDHRGILYVSPEGNGQKLGNTWTDAFNGLADALRYADSDPDVKEIWLKEGTYTPKQRIGNDNNPTFPLTDRDMTFSLRPGINVYGGFAGSESNVSERTLGHETILSGVIGNSEIETDSVYHVVVAIGDMKGAILDGVTIQGGRASGTQNNSFTHNNVSLNLVRSNGGGMYLHTAENLSVTDITVTENSSNSSGGGIYIVSSNSPSLQLENIRVMDNHSVGYGGGITIDSNSSPTITNMVITGNTTLSGGGIYNTYSSALLTDITVYNNSAREGGGIYNNNSSPIIKNSIITENTVSSRGGGIYNYSGFTGTCSPELYNVNITKNTVSGTGEGGGIYNERYNETSHIHLKMINTLIAENNSGGSGGGIYNNEGSLEIINSTITGNNLNNTRVGSGIYNNKTPGSQIINSIIWGNGTGSNNVFKSSIGEPTFIHSLIQGAFSTDGSWNTAIGTDGGNNIDHDPIFTNTDASDYSLTIFSPAVNKGNNTYITGITTDLAGNERINGNTVDMGAYEMYGTATPDADGVLYVSESGQGSHTGSSWDNAIPGLAHAIYTAKKNPAVKEIWIQAGTYIPAYHAGNGTTNRDKAFVLPPNVKIYGGFEGTETQRDQRDFEANKVILSGVTGHTGTVADSVYHVIVAVGDLGDTCLDGVTITGGKANGSSYIYVDGKYIGNSNGGGIIMDNTDILLKNVIVEGNEASALGGGIYMNNSNPGIKNAKVKENKAQQGGGGIFMNTSSPTIDSVQICRNIYGKATNGCYGGGMYINNSSAPQITNILIAENNIAENSISNNILYGGGIYIYNSSPEITNGIIRNNTTASLGGGIYVAGANSKLVLTNTLLAENSTTTSSGSGGAIYATGGGIELKNVTITGNTASYGGAIYYYNLAAGSTVKNSIIWENGSVPSRNIYKSGNNSIAFSYSLIQAWQTSMGEDEGNLITSDPMFADKEIGDYSLSVFSPAIDKGNDSYISISTDLAGNNRVYGNSVDMGAYELQSNPAGPNNNGVLFVSVNGDGEKLGNSWENSFPGLTKALEFAEANPSVKQLWLKAGTYYPETILDPYNQTERHRTIYLVKDLSLYGGFNGTENDIADRDWEANQTILSGDMNNDGLWNEEDVYHVVTASGDMGNALLDGLVITGGNTNGSPSGTNYGGGIYLYQATKVQIQNTLIKRNYARTGGGGIYDYSSSGILENVTFTDNESGQSGGGMYSIMASPKIENCIFDNNKAANSGGALYLQSGAGTINSTSFTNNQSLNGGAISFHMNTAIINKTVLQNNLAGSENAHGSGGAIYLSSSNNELVIINTIITGNKAAWGGAVFNQSNIVLTNVTISGNDALSTGGAIFNGVKANHHTRNSIIWRNSSGYDGNPIYYADGYTGKASIAYTLLENSGGSGDNWNEGFGEDEGNNIDADPRFIDAENNNFRLMQLSPARNSGNNDYFSSSAIPSLENYKFDLDDNPRFYKDGIVDLGAYESEWKTWLVLEDKTVTYNAQAQTINTVYVQEYIGAEPQVIGDETWVQYYYFDEEGLELTELPVNPGIYRVVAKFTGQGEYEAIETDTVLLSIEKIRASLMLLPGETVYTGEQLNIAPAVLIGTIGNVPIETYKYIKDGAETDHALNAGTYAVTAFFEGDIYHDALTSDEVEFKVEKAQPVINMTVNSMSYTGEAIEINEPTLSGSTTVNTLLPELKYSFRNTNGTYGPTSQAPTNADSYILTVSTDGDDNHMPAQIDAQFTIGINTPVLSLSSRQVIYNGQKVIIDDASIQPEQAKHLLIQYTYAGTLKDGTDYPETKNAPVDAGNYTVTASTEGDLNFAAVSTTAALEIVPKDASIAMENKSTPYTGNPISIETPVTDPSDAVLEITYEGQAGTIYNKTLNPPVDGGNYLVTATFAGDNNHHAKTATVNLIITDAGAPTLILNNLTVTYNGQPQSIGKAGISPEIAQYLEVTYYYSNASYEPTETPPTDAGVYTVTASTPADNNFTAGTVTATLTIEKANQVMNFQVIPAKQLGDLPFNLGVTVDSNLPLTYHSGNPTIASISEDGMVTIHRTGSVTLTARQEGNSNYNEVFQTQILNITSNYAEVYGVTINGEPIVVSENMYFDLGCSDETEFIIEIQTEEDASIDKGKRFSIVIDKPKLEMVEFTVTSQDLSQHKTYNLTIEKRFKFDDIIITRWNNTMTVINNPENNGGYTFTSYKWYRNGEEISTGQSYSAGNNEEILNESDFYYVEVSSNDFDGTLRTCESNPKLRSNIVTVYPNPVKSGNTITIDADIDDHLLEGASIDIYSVNGIRVSTVKVVDSKTPIKLFVPSGTYQIKLNGAEGYTSEMKIIVQ